MSSDALKNRILADTPLAALIGEHVKLSERGGLRVGCCPFHEENSASFTVYPDHYFCFGCRESGDAISFTRKIKGMGFIDALKFLGSRAGIDTTELDSQRLARSDRLDDAPLYQAMLLANDFFKEQLQSPRGEKARAYLVHRGFSPELIKEYGFGLALDEPRLLTDYLSQKHRLSPRDVEACSLASPSAKNGQLYDFFRNRVMIPIYDPHGRLVAFGGRALDDYPPKYKNSRETRLFDKSSVLFGYQRARDFIRKGEPAIIVEGYMDVLQLWTHGFPGAVACMGTALKTQHLRLLSNITNRVYLLFDGDQAGQKASLSTVAASLEFPRMDVRVAQLPADQDPDTYVQTFGPEKLKGLLSSSEQLIDAALKQKLANQSGIALADTVQRDIVPWLSAVEDTFRLEILLNRLSFHSGISKELLTDEVRKTRQQNRQGARSVPLEKPSAPRAPARPLSGIEFELLGHLYFAEPAEVDVGAIKDFVGNELELDDCWVDLATDFLDTLKRGSSPSREEKSRWVSALDPLVLELFDRLGAKAEAFQNPERALAFLRLRKEYSLKKRQLSIAALRSKLKTTAPQEVNQVLSAIMDINKEIGSIEKTMK